MMPTPSPMTGEEVKPFDAEELEHWRDWFVRDVPVLARRLEATIRTQAEATAVLVEALEDALAGLLVCNFDETSNTVRNARAAIAKARKVSP